MRVAIFLGSVLSSQAEIILVGWLVVALLGSPNSLFQIVVYKVHGSPGLFLGWTSH